MNFHKNSVFVSRSSGKTVVKSNETLDNRLAIMEALDHFFVTKLYQEIGLCKACRKICTKKCLACETNYCSSDCQNSDWPKHKLICSKLESQEAVPTTRNASHAVRPLKKCLNEPNLRENIRNGNVLLNDRDSPFKSFLDHQANKKRNDNSDQRHLSNGVCPLQNSANEVQNSNCKKGNSSSRDVSKMLDKGRDVYKKITANKSPSLESDVRFPITSSPKSSSREKLHVICTYRESENRYWVIKAEDATKYAKIQSELAEKCPVLNSITPKVGDVCGCIFEKEWYRGKILSLSPEMSVYFMDYGNTSVYEREKVVKLPEELTSQPPLAFLVEFESGSPTQYKTESLDFMSLTLEETRKADDGISCVNIVSGYFGPTSKSVQPKLTPPAMTVQETCIIDKLTENSKGTIFFASGNDRVRFGAVVPEGNTEAAHCLEQIFKFNTSVSPPIEAKEGDYVLAPDKDGKDQRGLIICKLGSIYYVRAIDCGNVLMTDSVFPMPESAKELIRLGAEVVIEEILLKNVQIESLDVARFAIQEAATSGRWPCILQNTNSKEPFARGFICKPKETIEAEPKFVFLKNGSSVEISALDSSDVYVRSVDPLINETLQEMCKKLSTMAAKVDCLKSPPKVNELCCAKFLEDSCFYRAQVTAVNENKVTVLFVDFGNTQETNLRDLKLLPDAFKNIPYFAVKVSLKKVTAKQLTHKSKQYLKKLAEEGADLILTFKDNLSEGVTLVEKSTGRSVNEMIEKEGKDEAFEEDLVTDEDLNHSLLPVGGPCDLFMLHIEPMEFDSLFSFWATDVNNENTLYVLGTLIPKTAEYCNSSQTPHRPKVHEVCFAEFEGEWYRALTISCTNDVFKVFFLDFGNTCDVHPESIRKFKKEFLEAPVLALNCSISGSSRLKGKPDLIQKVYNLLQERVNASFSGVEITAFENETFYVTIQEVEAILSE